MVSSNIQRKLVEFRAPWGRGLRWSTAISVALLSCVMLIGVLAGPRHLPLWWLVMVGAPLLMVAGSLPFMVRGFVLTESSIDVRRLGWVTSLPLAGLVSVTGEAEAVGSAWRLFGNGGLFGITGWFWSRKLGRFRVFATDLSRAVVLRYADRNIVVTPHDPQQFIVRVRTLVSLR